MFVYSQQAINGNVYRNANMIFQNEEKNRNNFPPTFYAIVPLLLLLMMMMPLWLYILYCAGFLKRNGLFSLIS